MTEVERLNDQLCELEGSRWSEYRANQIRMELNSAAELAKSFSVSGSVDEISLAVLLRAMQCKIDDLECELSDIRRMLDND